MTLTLKARTAAVILAAFCILAGLAIGQLTQADSARNGNGRQLDKIARKLNATNRQLANISKQLGGSSLTTISDQLGNISSNLGGGSILSIDYRLRQIEDSTRGTCRAVDGIGC